jgi:sec-independent protein translocase protein TatA
VGFPGGSELIIVLFIALLIFGTSRLPKLARSMGQAGREFKSGLKEGFKEEEESGDCPSCGKALPDAAEFCPNCGHEAKAKVVA